MLKTKFNLRLAWTRFKSTTRTRRRLSSGFDSWTFYPFFCATVSFVPYDTHSARKKIQKKNENKKQSLKH